MCSGSSRRPMDQGRGDKDSCTCRLLFGFATFIFTHGPIHHRHLFKKDVCGCHRSIKAYFSGPFCFSPYWTDSKFRLHAERCPDPWPLQAADAKVKRRRRRSLGGAQIGVRSDVPSILFSLSSLVSCGPPPNFSVSPSDDDTCETITPDGKVEKDRRGTDGVTSVHHV